jgi:hypothetical protein
VQQWPAQPTFSTHHLRVASSVDGAPPPAASCHRDEAGGREGIRATPCPSPGRLASLLPPSIVLLPPFLLQDHRVRPHSPSSPVVPTATGGLEAAGPVRPLRHVLPRRPVLFLGAGRPRSTEPLLSPSPATATSPPRIPAVCATNLSPACHAPHGESSPPLCSLPEPRFLSLASCVRRRTPAAAGPRRPATFGCPRGRALALLDAACSSHSNAIGNTRESAP